MFCVVFLVMVVMVRAISHWKEIAMIKTIVSSAVVCLLSTSAFAGVVTYDCEMTSYEKHGWIAPRVLVFVDRQNEVVGVFDGMIAETAGVPMKIEFNPRSDTKLKVGWKLNNIPARTGSASATYSGTMDEARLKLSLSVRVHGWDNRPSGTGKCKRTNIDLFK